MTNLTKQDVASPLEVYCECGCGDTPQKGRRFMVGHNRRKSGVAFILEDRGFSSHCWIWQRSTDGRYGCIGSERAHRIYYERHIGPIPEGLSLDHLCRITRCVNPFHLEPVTHQVNCQRGNQGKYQKDKTHCKNGHEFTEANTYWRTGGRACRECFRLNQQTPRAKERKAKWYQQHKASRASSTRCL